MAYRSRHGITNIKPFSKHGFNQLDISFEADDGYSDQRGTLKWDPKKCKPVLLFVPQKGDFDHEHITLTRGQAKKLHKWLSEYLADDVPGSVQHLPDAKRSTVQICSVAVQATAKPKNRITAKSLMPYVT